MSLRDETYKPKWGTSVSREMCDPHGLSGHCQLTFSKRHSVFESPSRKFYLCVCFRIHFLGKIRTMLFSVFMTFKRAQTYSTLSTISSCLLASSQRTLLLSKPVIPDFYCFVYYKYTTFILDLIIDLLSHQYLYPLFDLLLVEVYY